MLKKIIIAASTVALAMLGCASVAYAESSDSLGGHSSYNDDDNGGSYSDSDDGSYDDDGYDSSSRSGGLLGGLLHGGVLGGL
jgi:hypothetical protein